MSISRHTAPAALIAAAVAFAGVGAMADDTSTNDANGASSGAQSGQDAQSGQNAQPADLSTGDTRSEQQDLIDPQSEQEAQVGAGTDGGVTHGTSGPDEAEEADTPDTATGEAG